jgi:uncharacterized protein (UPF0332 family)
MNEYKPTPDVLQAMLWKARENLASAQKNLDSGFYGDVASRAYYAAFHAISAVLADHGLTFSSHAQTLGSFNRELIKTGVFPADTFRKLQRLFEDRQVADYDWNISVDEETAKQDLADAEWLVNACREYLEKRTGQLFSEK